MLVTASVLAGIFLAQDHALKTTRAALATTTASLATCQAERASVAASAAADIETRAVAAQVCMPSRRLQAGFRGPVPANTDGTRADFPPRMSDERWRTNTK